MSDSRLSIFRPRTEDGGRPVAPSIPGALIRIALGIVVMYVGLGLVLGYWQVIEASRLTQDPRNPLALAAARAAPRGSIFDVNGELLAESVTGPNGTIRRYPSRAVSPIVGYRSRQFGAAGLEQAYDQLLIGLGQLTPGDELLRKFRPTPYDPNDLMLSIDLRLQQAAMSALQGQRGAIVAIEPSTGRVLAMASVPSFDPNRVVDPVDGAAYLELLRNRQSAPLFNRAAQGLYVPGSTFKAVTAVAGLGSNALSRETTFEDQPAEYETGFLVEGFRIRDSPRPFQTTEPLNLIEATEVSSNIYFAHAALEIGAERMIEWAERLGIGARLPFDLATSASQVTRGRGPDGSFVDKVELASAAFGQGEVLVTPLQMALVAAMIGNDGVMMKPKLVDSVRAASGSVHELGPEVLHRVLDGGDAAVLQEALQTAVEGRYGKTFAGAAKVQGIPTAGKSGSAQLGDSNEPHSWFIGFAPVEAPRIAIAVIVERAGFGSEQAVPIAGQLMTQYFELTGR